VLHPPVAPELAFPGLEEDEQDVPTRNPVSLEGRPSGSLGCGGRGGFPEEWRARSHTRRVSTSRCA